MIGASPASFSNEHRMKYYGVCSCDRSRRGKISRSARASPVLAPVLPCYAPVPGPVIHLFDFPETPILSALRADRPEIPCCLQGGGEKTGVCRLQLCCRKLNARRSIDLSPLDAKKRTHSPVRGGCRLTIVQPSFGVLPKRTQRANPERSSTFCPQFVAMGRHFLRPRGSPARARRQLASHSPRV